MLLILAKEITMKHLLTSSIVLIIVCLLCGGCASSFRDLEGDNLLPEIDIVQVKEHSDEALKLAQEAKLTVDAVNARLTKIDNQLVALSEEVSAVSLAKIEELENRLSLLIEAYKDLQEQLSSLEVLPRVKTKKTGGAGATFSPSGATGLITSPEYTMYQNALRTFDKRNYDQSEKEFVEVLNKYPKGDYASNSQYWIGECNFARGDFAKAIAAFLKVLTYDNSSKADDAQFKLGVSYLRMGKNDLAKHELKKLVNRYPSSEYVSHAEKYLANIN